MVDYRLVAQDHAAVISDTRTSNELPLWAAACEYFFRMISDVDGCICSPKWQVTVSLGVSKAMTTMNCMVDKAKSEIHSYTGTGD